MAADDKKARSKENRRPIFPPLLRPNFTAANNKLRFNARRYLSRCLPKPLSIFRRKRLPLPRRAFQPEMNKTDVPPSPPSRKKYFSKIPPYIFRPLARHEGTLFHALLKKIPPSFPNISTKLRALRAWDRCKRRSTSLELFVLSNHFHKEKKKIVKNRKSSIPLFIDERISRVRLPPIQCETPFESKGVDFSLFSYNNNNRLEKLQERRGNESTEGSKND